MRARQIAVCVAAVCVAFATVGCQPKRAVALEGQIIEITDSLMRHGGTDTVHLGKMRSGEVVSKQLLFHNATAEPIVVLRYETSCRCVDFDYERAPIMPDSLSPVACRFDSATEWGWQLKLVVFRLTMPDTALRLIIEAEVE